ncbi:hypothetical protein SDC9_156517 [bioreactor metagenome]|uniref:Uncharacterized protein n=1 Tax=bioreactor metagenome TaxID=1076179 RepID=A0A645F4E2_9ZZZZ
MLSIAHLGHDQRVFHLDRHSVKEVVFLQQLELKHIQQMVRLFDIISFLRRSAGHDSCRCFLDQRFPIITVIRGRIENRQEEGDHMFAWSRICFKSRTRAKIILDFPIFIQMNFRAILFSPFNLSIERKTGFIPGEIRNCPALKQLHPFLEGRVAVSYILNILRIVSH